MKTSLLLTAVLACATTAYAVSTPTTKPSTPTPPSCRVGLPPGKYSETSLYTLDSTWTTDAGREVKLDVLRGYPQVVAMFFTNCQHSCPFIVADMKGIEKALPRGVRGKVDFLLVSIDPSRDTPEVLRAYREKHNLGMEHWTLLRGSADAVKQLAEKLGFQYYPGSERQFGHTLVISVLNQSGEIVFQQAGIGALPDGAVDTLVRLLKQSPKGKR
ncbi:MAG: SCO family protein [Chthoniobacter sp.]|nr:SCO family protein [Chthoniobacter sp.]